MILLANLEGDEKDEDEVLRSKATETQTENLWIK